MENSCCNKAKEKGANDGGKGAQEKTKSRRYVKKTRQAPLKLTSESPSHAATKKQETGIPKETADNDDSDLHLMMDRASNLSLLEVQQDDPPAADAGAQNDPPGNLTTRRASVVAQIASPTPKAKDPDGAAVRRKSNKP